MQPDKSRCDIQKHRKRSKEEPMGPGNRRPADTPEHRIEDDTTEKREINRGAPHANRKRMPGKMERARVALMTNRLKELVQQRAETC